MTTGFCFVNYKFAINYSASFFLRARIAAPAPAAATDAKVIVGLKGCKKRKPKRHGNGQKSQFL